MIALFESPKVIVLYKLQTEFVRCRDPASTTTPSDFSSIVSPVWSLRGMLSTPGKVYITQQLQAAFFSSYI